MSDEPLEITLVVKIVGNAYSSILTSNFPCDLDEEKINCYEIIENVARDAVNDIKKTKMAKNLFSS